jgi:hypothetical protein
MLVIGMKKEIGKWFMDVANAVFIHDKNIK